MPTRRATGSWLGRCARILLAPPATISGHSPTGVAPQYPDQQYCEQVKLGPDAKDEPVYATAFVPTQHERFGFYKSFVGMLVDPNSGVPFLRGLIAPEQRAAGLFAWRIATPKLHTSITLANALAHRYSGTVTIYGNVADATHGQSTGEVLGDGDATQPFAPFVLRQTPLTYLSAPTASGSTSTLQVRVNERAWHEAPDLWNVAAGQRSSDGQ